MSQKLIWMYIFASHNLHNTWKSWPKQARLKPQLPAISREEILEQQAIVNKNHTHQKKMGRVLLDLFKQHESYDTKIKKLPSRNCQWPKLPYLFTKNNWNLKGKNPPQCHLCFLPGKKSAGLIHKVGPQLYKKGINNPYKYMAGKAHDSFTFFF